ncbi:MAG: D-alanyl-D-alanine carboxypeptidase/D-alanyl-D-alanine-endopeptidase, partial [Cyanobacteria bacterium P01_H01_bin.15]
APTYRGAKWGILVESLASGEIVYHYNANSFLIPASNTKLLTTAAALQRLRPEDAIFSKSVRDWVTTTNLRSNNQYAERLLKHIGGAWAAKQALTEMGISPEGFRIADGSGLSRNNFTTPRTLVNLLRAMHSDQNRDVFLSSLPVAGVSGTLRNRMRQTSAQGAVYAKTGTLRGVRALSGYLENPHHGTLIFSILVNQPGVYGNALVTGIDKVVLQLQSAAPCN